MDVELRQITSETVRAICELDVAADQRSFVAPNAVSIAKAHFTPEHWMRAIYADGQPVGFVLTFDEASEDYFLWRFMIAEGHQRRGIAGARCSRCSSTGASSGPRRRGPACCHRTPARLASTNRSVSGSPARRTTENS